MGLWTRLKNAITGTDVWGESWLSQTQTVNPVTEQTALQQAAVYACVDLIARSMASMPISTNRIDDQGFPSPDRSYHLFYTLNVRANKMQSGFEMREFLVRSLLLHGAAYAFKGRDRLGVVRELTPIPFDRVSVEMSLDGRDILYTVTFDDGTSRVLTRRDVLHVRGAYSDMVHPISPIRYAAQTISNDISMSKHADQSFGDNAARPGGIIQSKKKLDKNTAKNLEKRFSDKWNGQGNAWKTHVLDQDMTWTPIEMSNSDQQFLESRRFSVEQICRIFAVPPEMIGQTIHSSYNQAEQQFLTFSNFTLAPLAKRLEAEFLDQLVEDRTAQLRIDFEHDFWSLTRGDTKTVSDALRGLVQGGLMTPNEGRGRLGLTRNQSEGADQLYIQQNMASVDNLNRMQAVQGNPAAEEEARSAAQALIDSIGGGR